MKDLKTYIHESVTGRRLGESVLSDDVADKIPLSKEDIVKIANKSTKKFLKMEIEETTNYDKHGARLIKGHNSNDSWTIQWFIGHFTLEMTIYDNKELGRPQYTFDHITYQDFARPRATQQWYAHGGSKKCLLKFADKVEEHMTEILKCWATAGPVFVANDDAKLTKAKFQSICKRYFPDTWNAKPW